MRINRKFEEGRRRARELDEAEREKVAKKKRDEQMHEIEAILIERDFEVLLRSHQKEESQVLTQSAGRKAVSGTMERHLDADVVVRIRYRGS